MSNYCQACPYEPQRRTGDKACPLTVLYWHFLKTHEAELGANPRTSLMVKNLQRIEAGEMAEIEAKAQAMLADLDDL
jgi:deoxyribodipyrimidine photolyase-related protein